MTEIRDLQTERMKRTDGQYYKERLKKMVLLRNNGALARCLETFCKENIWRGSQSWDRVEIKRET